MIFASPPQNGQGFNSGCFIFHPHLQKSIFSFYVYNAHVVDFFVGNTANRIRCAFHHQVKEHQPHFLLFRNQIEELAKKLLPVCREKNITETLKYLKASGIRVVCATEKGKMNYTQASFTEPVCVVMGAEDKGISKEVLKLCDEQLAIPLIGHTESLNVAAAAAIMLYEVVRQRIGE